MKLDNRSFYAISAFLLLGFAPAPGQDRVEEGGYVTCPVEVQQGVLVSDNYGSGLFLASASGVQELFSGRGTGRYWSLSPDRKTIGYKRILDDGLQVPELFDIASGSIRRLHSPVPLAGQVSFSADGSAAFMVGTKLVVVRESGEVAVEIGTYSNIAPISPDGSRIAYSDNDGVVRIRDLTSGAEREICAGGNGHGFPAWSPDGTRLLYSDLAGNAFVFNLQDGSTVELGQALAPAWSPDGTRIVFYRKEVAAGRLVNSDLFQCRADGSDQAKITSTPDVCEMDPSFAIDGGSILCHTYDQRSVRSIQPADGHTEELVRTSRSSRDSMRNLSLSGRPRRWTFRTSTRSTTRPTGSTAIQPAGRRPPPCFSRTIAPFPHGRGGVRRRPGMSTYGDDTCPTATGSKNPIISGRPTTRTNGSLRGDSATCGASGSPHSMMASYYNRHGIAASTLDSPSLQTAVNEVEAGRPYSLCVDLTTAGHIVLAHGYEGNGTFVTNDPYGDKNKPGYPNTYGKNARYDWPGWNNGHVNFGRYVYWAVSGSYTRPAVTDTLVDDLQIDTGFLLYNQAPVSMMSWKDANKGYAGHFWYTYTHAGSAPDSCFATWTPNLAQAGAYEVFAYIPYSNATAARYKVSTIAGQRTVEIDQKAYRDAWVSLGTYDLGAGSAGVVRLGDASTADRQELVFDAVRWSYRGTATVVERAGAEPIGGFALEQNYPNPFNPSTILRYALPVAGPVRLAVFDPLGREVGVLVDALKPAGRYEVEFDGGGLTSGTYFVRLTTGTLRRPAGCS